MSWVGPGLHGKESISQPQAFVAVCFLTTDAVSPASASSCCLCDSPHGPTVSWSCDPEWTLFPLLAFQTFISAARKESETVSFGFYWICLLVLEFCFVTPFTLSLHFLVPSAFLIHFIISWTERNFLLFKYVYFHLCSSLASSMKVGFSLVYL